MPGTFRPAIIAVAISTFLLFKSPSDRTVWKGGNATLVLFVSFVRAVSFRKRRSMKVLCVPLASPRQDGSIDFVYNFP